MGPFNDIYILYRYLNQLSMEPQYTIADHFNDFKKYFTPNLQTSAPTEHRTVEVFFMGQKQQGEKENGFRRKVCGSVDYILKKI